MLKALGQHLCWPEPRIAGSAQTTTVDSASDFVGAAFVAPMTGTITDLHFRTGTVGTSQSLTGGIYTFDETTGGPGTLVGTAGTIASVTSNTNHNFSGGLSASVTKGTRYVLKISFTSTVGNVPFISQVSSYVMSNMGLFPFRIVSTDNAGTLTRATSGAVLPVSIEYSGGVFPPVTGVGPCGTSGSLALASNGMIAGGARFKVPVPMTVHGLWVQGTFTNNSSCMVELYDDATAAGGTPLASAGFDEDALSSTSNGIAYVEFSSGDVTLQPGVWYRAAIRNTATTSATVYKQTSLPSIAHQKCYSGTEDFYLTTYTGSAWTDTTTEMPFIGLMIGDIHDNSGIGAASMSLGI